MLDNAQQVSLEEKRITRYKVAVPLLILGMVSIFMVFAAFTSAYIVRQADANWLTFDMPTPFFISTLIIVLSSITLYYSNSGVKNNNFNRIKQGLLATIILGFGFVISQVYTYDYMMDQGLYFVGTNVSSSFMYIITGAHLVHIVSGMIALFVSYYKATKNKYTSEEHLGLRLTSLYWHFLDALWIFLLLFLLFIR
tara:strand:+ start:463 stop:1050 length:588 start_codon:yes stop_codon:yes gene_type:complete